MVTANDEQKLPPPTDVSAWRRIADEERLREFVPGVIVAAFQDSGPKDRRLREKLALYLSDLVMRMLRKRVGANKPDGGNSIIDRVHGDFFEAILQPKSADGKAYRKAFSTILDYRVKDAVAKEYSCAVIDPKDPSATANDGTTLSALAKAPDIVEQVDVAREGLNGGEGYGGRVSTDPSLRLQIEDFYDKIDIERALARVTDLKKRLAFRYFMDGVPFGGDKGSESIARALGISNKTAEHWVREVCDILRHDPVVHDMQRRASGDRS